MAAHLPSVRCSAVSSIATLGSLLAMERFHREHGAFAVAHARCRRVQHADIGLLGAIVGMVPVGTDRRCIGDRITCASPVSFRGSGSSPRVIHIIPRR